MDDSEGGVDMMDMGHRKSNERDAIKLSLWARLLSCIPSATALHLAEVIRTRFIAKRELG